MKSFLRLRSFYVLSAEDRSRQRYRRAGLTSVAGIGARAVAVVVVLVSTPLAVRHLGTEQYGLWVTIMAITALAGVADLGLSNGLVNAIAAEGDHPVEARRTVSSAFFLLALIGGAVAALFFLAFPHVPWAEVFNVTTRNAANQAAPSMAVFTACFLVGLPLGITQRIHLGFQEGYIASLWQIVASLLSLAGIVLAVALGASLPWFVLASAGPPVIAMGLNTVVLFGLQRPWLRLRMDGIHLATVKRLLRLGVLFFILQIAGVVSYQTDNIVVARILGAEEVAQFAIPMRLFLLIPSLLGLFWIALWPAYREAAARGDSGWVRSTLRRSLVIASLLSSAAAGLLMVFGPFLLRKWVGGSIQPSMLLLTGMAAWSIVASVSGSLGMFLNGMNAIKFQAVSALVAAIVNVTLSIWLTRTIGLAGPAWGSTIAQSVVVLLPALVLGRRLLSRLEAF